MPIDPILGGALISTGGNFIANQLTNSGSRRSQKRADRYNRAFWHMQNEYNLPINQRARLEEAGVNYNHVIKGGANPGNAGQIAPSKAAPYKFDNPLLGIEKYQNIKTQQAQTDNFKTQNTVLANEAALKAIQTSETAAKTARSKFDLSLAKDLRSMSIDAAKESLRQQKLNNLGTILDNKFKDKTLKDRVLRIATDVEVAKSTLKGQDLLNRLRQLEVEYKELGIEKTDSFLFRLLGRNLNNIQQFPDNYLKRNNIVPRN